MPLAAAPHPVAETAAPTPDGTAASLPRRGLAALHRIEIAPHEPRAGLAAMLRDDIGQRLEALPLRLAAAQNGILPLRGAAPEMRRLWRKLEQPAVEALDAPAKRPWSLAERLAEAETATALAESWCRLAEAEAALAREAA